MKHADWLAERILFLDGLPNFQLLGRLRIGETVEEVLKADLRSRRKRSRRCARRSPIARSVRDYISRDLLKRILDNEEEHVDMLERQFDLIKLMGLPELCPAAVASRPTKAESAAAESARRPALLRAPGPCGRTPPRQAALDRRIGFAARTARASASNSGRSLTTSAISSSGA